MSGPRLLAAGFFALVATAAITAAAPGCSSSPAAEDARGEAQGLATSDAATPDAAAPDGGAAPSPYSSCHASIVAKVGIETLSFSTSLPCAADGGACPSQATTLTASASSSSAGSSATWTIAGGGQTVMTLSALTSGTTTTTTATIGPAIQGVHSEQFTQSGTVLTGTVDGRAIVPMDLSSTNGKVTFADGAPAPTLSISPALQAAMHTLMQAAHSDAASLCRYGIAPVTAAINALDAAMPVMPAPLPAPSANDAGTSPSNPAAPADPTFPVPENGGPFTDQNNLVEWATPDCQGCEMACTPLIIFATAAYPACAAACFNPLEGCAEQICLEDLPGFGSCDRSEACCGNICCSGGQVCGNMKYGACCPSDLPVGCGDETGVTCWPAGYHCCLNWQFACAPDEACQNADTTNYSCCAPDHVDTLGQCCQNATCNGACCDNGVCTDGVCCSPGETVCGGQCCNGACIDGQCCNGVNQQVCNGSCCNGKCCGGSCCPSGSCTANGTCCQSGQPACGGTCCPSNAACTDPTKSTCSGTATVLQFWDPSTSTGSAGNSLCGLFACEPEYWGYPLTLRGTGYAAGTVTITVAAPAGNEIVTAQADASGQFVVTLTPTGYGSADVPITATETAGATKYSASVLAYFTQLK